MRVRSRMARQLALSGTLAIGGALAVAGPAAAIAPGPPAGVASGTVTQQSDGAGSGLTIGPFETSPATVSTIVVPAGTQDVIRDVDVRTLISHTASGDLDISLTSPAGTTVALVVGPGAAGGSDDSFDGTLWDDSAGLLASDGPYPAPAGAAESLVPEGALGAFVGEDPAGTWTLRVRDVRDVDDADPETPQDGGTLESWELRLATQDAVPPTTLTEHTSAGGLVAIPDDAAASVEKTVTVAGAKPYLWDLDLVTDIVHDVPGDLEIRVTGPGGQTAVVSTRNDGPTGFYVGRVFDDSAPALVTTTTSASGPVVAEGALAAFIGSDPNGVWTFRVADAAAGDTGTLNGVTLRIRAADGPSAPAPQTPAPVVPPGVAISSAERCLPTSPAPVAATNPAGAARVAVTTAQLRINQRIFQAAVRRANAVQSWIDAGLVTGDLCGGAIGTKQLGSGIATGALPQVQALSLPAPRPVTVAAAVSKPNARFELTAGQFLINQRVAQAAVRRANGLQERFAGNLTGGDIRDGQVTQDKLNGGLAVLSARVLAPPPAASTTRIAARTGGDPSRVRVTAGQLLIDQRIGQAAIRRLNALTARVESGLTAANLAPASVTAADLSADLRK